MNTARIRWHWIFFLLLLVFAGSHRRASSAPQEVRLRLVRGSVFEDGNSNGLRDAGERSLPGIGVSDQAAVVTTAPDGQYRLEAAPASQVVFVSLPDGWAAPAGFWRPLGDEGEQRIDFPLQRRAVTPDFTFIHASDTHLSAESLTRLRRFREEVERRRPAFVLITGDLVRDALRVPESEARGYYEMLVAELARFPVPVWTVPGNHEIFGIERHRSLVSPQHPLYGKKMYRYYLRTELLLVHLGRRALRRPGHRGRGRPLVLRAPRCHPVGLAATGHGRRGTGVSGRDVQSHPLGDRDRRPLRL